MTQPIALAIVSNEPTPHRRRVIDRLSRELPEVRLHCLFTHALDNPADPWRLGADGSVPACGFPAEHLTPGRVEPLRQLRLFTRLRDYIIRHRCRAILLLGYHDLARLALIRWARAAGVPLLLAADSNVLSEGRVGGARRAARRLFFRWIAHHVSSLLPMGTCGRAFFRLYADHDTPTFLFPIEPDYAALEQPDPAAVRSFQHRHGLDPSRRRILCRGRFAPGKGIESLVDAFVHIAHDRPEWDLLLAPENHGQPPSLDPAPQDRVPLDRVPLELRARVKILHGVPEDGSAACCHACDILAEPSEYEPWALRINEAVASGMAVVATEMVGAAVELVRHGANGLIVPPRSPLAMAEALRFATRPEVCQAMREAAPAVLAQWRSAADPVAGLRQALRHVRLIPSPA